MKKSEAAKALRLADNLALEVKEWTPAARKSYEGLVRVLKKAL